MYRSLIHYWRVNLAVLAGAAVATAVLTGALIVGDSIRGSLRDLTLERLGNVDRALVGERFFREELAADLAAGVEAAPVPAILLRGTAVHGDTGARASNVAVQGVDGRFATLFPDAAFDFSRAQGQIFPSIVINESLRRELDAAPGDSLIVSFARASDIPRDTLMGEKDPQEVLGRVRVTVRSVVADRGVGRFGLQPNQQTPLNAFVDLKQIQRALGQREQVNAVLLPGAGAGAEADAAALAGAIDFDDLGLVLEDAGDHLTITSREFVLRPNVDAAIGAVAGQLGRTLLRTQSYLANTIRLGDREVPYSMVAALDPIPGADWSGLTFADGSSVDEIGDGEILLTRWTADDLRARPGDRVDLIYYEVGPREELVEQGATFRVKGILRDKGLAADRTLTPDYPGIQEAADMSAWDPPFPVELDRIRPVDEDYWDEFGPTPKAFVAERTGRDLWATRYGTTTSARIDVPEGGDSGAIREQFRNALFEKLPPETFGFVIRPVKAEGLAASSGATDFAGLFIGFSFFLIVSSALLVGLLFSLNVEQRAKQVGLMLAVGYPLTRVRRRLLAEGGVLAAAGALLGLAAGVGYAGLLMLALRTIWLPAVGSSALFLHVTPLAIGLGWIIAVLVILLSIWWTVRRLNRIPLSALLAGSLRPDRPLRQRRITAILAWTGLLGGTLIAGYAITTGASASPGLSFGSGSLLLISGLAWFALWCRGVGGSGLTGKGAIVGMAARNSSWNPGRSILSVALVASACFVIVAVAANRHEFGGELAAKDSGSGGFSLIAESDSPLFQDLSRPGDRGDLGFSPEESAQLAQAEIVAFRYLPGDDTSCLNLYQPEKPRVLGVPQTMIARGGFSFQQTIDGAGDNPWELLEQEFDPIVNELGLTVPVVPAIGDFNSMQWILHLPLGGDVLIDDEYGNTIALRLVGTFAKSVFQSEMLISEGRFLEHFPSRGGYSTFLFDAPAGAGDGLATLLESKLADFGFDVSTTKDRLASYEIVQNTYLSTFQTLGGLGLLLGTVGLGVVLFRNVIERRGELATLRAFGFRRRQLAWMVLLENAFLLVVGVGVGTLSAILGVAPRLAQTHIPWASLSATLGVVLLVGMLSSIVAVSGVLRNPLLATLKAER